jgi:TorA maturation chaperone TorD
MEPAGTARHGADPLDAERARLFALLGRLLSAAPDAGLLARLTALRGDTSPLGRAFAGLAEAAAATTPAEASREYFALFIGVGRGELLPYASYYLTGFLHERPLAELRGTLRQLGIERAAGVAEPEDHLAFCCEVMAGLLEGRFGDASPDAFFARHLAPWAGRCFADLAAAEAAQFYRAVGVLGRTVIDIEQAAAELPA